MKSSSAKQPFHSGIHGPLVSGAGIVLGAAGRQRRSAPCSTEPNLCPCAGPLPFSGCGPCGSIPRPM